MVKISFDNVEIEVSGKIGWAIKSISQYMNKKYGIEISNEDLLFLNSVFQDVDDE